MADFLAIHFGIKHIVREIDSDQKLIAEAMGSICYRFAYSKTEKFVENLKQILQKAKKDDFQKCFLEKEKWSDEVMVDKFMEHLNLLDQNQLFLSKEFESK